MVIDEIVKRQLQMKQRPISEAFDYNREKPKTNHPLKGEYLEPKARKVVKDFLNGATREWICVNYGISPEQLAVYLHTARLAGYDIEHGQRGRHVPEEKKLRVIIKNALLKNWDVSIHELKTLTRNQNADSLSSVRARMKKELRKEFPDRWPDNPKKVIYKTIRETLMQNWNITPSQMNEILEMNIPTNKLSSMIAGIRHQLRKKFPGKWPEADTRGNKLNNSNFRRRKARDS